MKRWMSVSLVVGACLVALAPGAVAQSPRSGPAKISPTDAFPSTPSRGGAFGCTNGGSLLINQQPDQSNGIFADSDCGNCAATGAQSLAENFALAAPTSVSQVFLWGGYFPGNGIPGTPDAFTILFHQDNAGEPGAVIDSQVVVPSSATQTGAVLFGVNEVLYEVDIAPVALAPGTHWVEIFTDSSATTDSFFWEAGTQDATSGVPLVRFSTSTPGVSWAAATGASALAFALCDAPAVDLSVNKVADVSVAGPGDPVSYTITVANAGPADAPGTQVSDPFPAELTGVSWTCSASAGSSCAAMGMGDINDLANVLAGGSVTYSVTATIDAAFVGTLSNTAMLTPDAAVQDRTTADDSSTADVTVLAPVPTLGQVALGLLALGLAFAALTALRRVV